MTFVCDGCETRTDDVDVTKVQSIECHECHREYLVLYDPAEAEWCLERVKE